MDHMRVVDGWQGHAEAEEQHVQMLIKCAPYGVVFPLTGNSTGANIEVVAVISDETSDQGGLRFEI
jgi:hypothetical protein